MFLRASLVPVASAIVLLVVAVIRANEVLVYVAFGLTGVSVLLVALGLFAPNLGRRPAADAAPLQTGAASPSVHEPMGQSPASAQPTQWTPPPTATPPQQRWQYPTSPGLVPAPSGPRDPERGGGSSDNPWPGPPMQGGPVVDGENSSSPAGAAGDSGASRGPSAHFPAHAPISDTVDDEAVLDTPDAAPHTEGEDGADLMERPENAQDDEVVNAEDPDHTESGPTEASWLPEAAEDAPDAAAASGDADEDQGDAPESASVVRSHWDADVFANVTAEHTELDRDPTAGPQAVEPTEPEASATFTLDAEDLAQESPTSEGDETDLPLPPEDLDTHDTHTRS